MSINIAKLTIDFQTIVLISTIIACTCLVVLVTVIKTSYPCTIGGISEWILAVALAICGAFFVANPASLPMVFARWAGNLLLVSALFLMYISLQKFAKRYPRRRQMLTLAAIAMTVYSYFNFVVDEYSIRVYVAMATQILFFIACIFIIKTVPKKEFPEYLTITLFCALILICTFRIAVTSIENSRIESVWNESVSQQRILSGYAILLVMLMLSFMLIISRRLRETLVHLEAYPEFDSRARDALWSLTQELQAALKNSQFVLHFQPRICGRNGTVIGVESLVRWQHPQRGMVGPTEFIPQSERSGIILEIGKWVFANAVQCLNRLNQLHPGMRMSINISAHQLNDRTFLDFIEQQLKLAKFEKGQLELELTEYVVIDDPNKAQKNLNALKTFGIQLALDDFGTGYSSLSYLIRLPFDSVKIDRSFIQHLTDDDKSETLIKAIISMAHALGLRVIAEGVETQAQKDRLHMLNCDEYQGYLYSKPIPEKELSAYIFSNAASRT